MATDDQHADGEGDERHAWTWSRRQRQILIALLMALCVVFGIRAACNRAYVSNPPPATGPRYDEVADKIDPNTADLATLSALPMIGEKRAAEIIEYRERRRATFPNERVFNSADDLLRIKGFGAATVETMRPYLIFPTTPATTRP